MSKQKLPPALKGSSCILHIDLEQVRLGLSADQPVAVQQWQGLIAVNYPAKAAGITRHMPIEEAYKKCPNLRPVHVATFNMHDPVARYHEDADQTTHKVSLDVYRKASLNIFKIFLKHCSKVQKAGLDEAFLDVTEIVNAKLTERYANEIASGEEFSREIDWEPLGFLALSDEESELINPTSQPLYGETNQHLIATDKSPPAPKLRGNWKDLQLSIGAEVAKEIRKEIFDILHYTCSAGIAHNKTVAKLCSALNKPNKQTSMRESIVPVFMKSIPFTKIRNLGGKFGNEIESALNIQTAGDLWKYSVEELQVKFGQGQGIWLYDICRGIDTSEVTQVKIAKSMMASKVFSPPLRSLVDVERWIAVLGAEIYMRIMDDFEERSRWPRTLMVHFRAAGEFPGRSKSCPMVRRIDVISPDVLTQRAIELFRACERPFPLLHLSITASGFEIDESTSTHNIKKFFGNANDAKLPIASLETKSPIESFQPDLKPRNQLKGIAAMFVSKAKASAPENKDGHTQCDECHEWIISEETQEHADFHFAKRLQDEDRLTNTPPPPPPPLLAPSQAPSKPSPSSSSKTKKRKSPTQNDEHKDSRRLFFQPRRS